MLTRLNQYWSVSGLIFVWVIFPKIKPALNNRQHPHSQTADEPQPAADRYKNHIRISWIWYALKVESQSWLTEHEIRDFYELRRGSYNVSTLMSSAMVSITQTGHSNRAHLPLQTQSSVKILLYLLYQLLTDTESMSNFLTASRPSDVG